MLTFRLFLSEDNHILGIQIGSRQLSLVPLNLKYWLDVIVAKNLCQFICLSSCLFVAVWVAVHPFMYLTIYPSFIEFLLLSDIILVTEDTAMNKTDKTTVLMELII